MNGSGVSNGTNDKSAVNVENDDPGKNQTCQFLDTVPVPGIQFTCIIITVVGNGAVILAVLTNAKLRRLPNNLFICALAINDFLIGAIIMPIDAMTYAYRPGSEMARIDHPLQALRFVLLGSSVWSLCVVSYDRYRLITRSLNYRSWMTKLRVSLFCIGGWVITACMCLAIFILDRFSFPGQLYYIVTVQALSNGIPMVIMLKANTQVVCFTRRGVRTGSALDKIMCCNKTTFVLSLLVCSCYIFIGPLEVVYTLSVVSDKKYYDLYCIAHWAAYGNSLINPFVYTMFNANFRKAFFAVCSCACRSFKSSTNISSMNPAAELIDIMGRSRAIQLLTRSQVNINQQNVQPSVCMHDTSDHYSCTISFN